MVPSAALRRTSDVPKPLQTVGGRPLLQHLMSWYVGHGHRSFVLCLGVGAEFVRKWVCSIADRVEPHDSLQHVLSLTLHGGEFDGVRVDMADTGIDACVGERLRLVRPLVADEEFFLANYADGLTDLPLPDMVEMAVASQATAAFVAVPPPSSLHSVVFDQATGVVRSVAPLSESGIWINGGFFVLHRSIFDVLGLGEDLVEAPFGRLAADGRLLAYPYLGFWRACDTMKDRQALQDLWESGDRRWVVGAQMTGMA